MNTERRATIQMSILSCSERQYQICPELLTESELIDFLRIPEVSKAKDHHNVIAHLKRFHDLPRIHICGQPLYPREAIQQWIRDKTGKGK